MTASLNSPNDHEQDCIKIYAIHRQSNRVVDAFVVVVIPEDCLRSLILLQNLTVPDGVALLGIIYKSNGMLYKKDHIERKKRKKECAR